MKIEKIAALTGHNAPIYALATGRDDRHFYSAGGDGWVVEWSLDSPELGRVVAEVGLPVFSLFFFKKENLLVAGDQNGGVRFIPLENPAAQRHILHHKKGIFDIQFFDNQLFTLGGDGYLTRWDWASRRPLESIRIAPKSLRCAIFLEKRREIVVGASDGNLYFLDGDGLFLKNKIDAAHDPAVFCGVSFEEKNQLITGGRDAHLRFWELGNDPILMKTDLPAHLFTINHVVFVENWLVTASRDRTLKIWDPATGELLKVVDTLRHGGHLRSVNRLLALPGGELVSAGDDRQGIIWQLSN